MIEKKGRWHLYDDYYKIDDERFNVEFNDT